MKAKENIKNLLGKSQKELTNQLADSYNKIQKLKFSKSFGKLTNQCEISQTKKNIARIWTILRLKDKEKSK